VYTCITCMREFKTYSEYRNDRKAHIEAELAKLKLSDDTVRFPVRLA
jgi:hypothetical protein